MFENNEDFKEYLKFKERLEKVEALLERLKEFQVQNNRDLIEIKKIFKKEGKWIGMTGERNDN